MSVSLESLSVVLVEPSKAQARIVVSLLEELGINMIRHYRRGEEALEGLFSNVSPDITFSAMHLPDITGAEMVGRMREHHRTHDAIFSLMSSEQSPRYLEPLRQAGVISILSKPLKVEALRGTLVSAIELMTPSDLEINGYLDDIRVLVVDDSPTARRFMRRVLESLGLERITMANDGKEGADMVEDQVFDLIVTDLHMPRMNGIEFLEFIRTRSLRPSTPVLMVTSEQNQARLEPARALNVSAICDKPFEPGLVRQLLGQMLSF